MNETKGFSVQKWAFASECRVVHAEIDEGWWQLCGVPAVGAILVQPDEHVAWRSTTATESSSVHCVMFFQKFSRLQLHFLM
jgi:hypothetical protein